MTRFKIIFILLLVSLLLLSSCSSEKEKMTFKKMKRLHLMIWKNISEQ